MSILGMLTGPRRKGYSMALEYRKVTKASDAAEKVLVGLASLTRSQVHHNCIACK